MTATTTTADDTSTPLSAESLAGFRAALRGQVLIPGDAGYDTVRMVWNKMIDRRPQVIARCTGPADVIAAVTFGREHGLLIAIHG